MDMSQLLWHNYKMRKVKDKNKKETEIISEIKYFKECLDFKFYIEIMFQTIHFRFKNIN